MSAPGNPKPGRGNNLHQQHSVLPGRPPSDTHRVTFCTWNLCTAHRSALASRNQPRPSRSTVQGRVVHGLSLGVLTFVRAQLFPTLYMDALLGPFHRLEGWHRSFRKSWVAPHTPKPPPYKQPGYRLSPLFDITVIALMIVTGMFAWFG